MQMKYLEKRTSHQLDDSHIQILSNVSTTGLNFLKLYSLNMQYIVYRILVEFTLVKYFVMLQEL